MGKSKSGIKATINTDFHSHPRVPGKSLRVCIFSSSLEDTNEQSFADLIDQTADAPFWLEKNYPFIPIYYEDGFSL